MSAALPPMPALSADVSPPDDLPAALRVAVRGVGGQGSLTLSRLLGEAALLAGQNVVVSEVHGMSQRGGVVESSVLIGDVKSPLIGAQDADLLVAFESVEGLRAASYVSKKTVVIVNERKNVPFSVSMGRAMRFTLIMARKMASRVVRTVRMMTRSRIL